MTLLDHFAENLSRHNARTGDRGGDVGVAAGRLGRSRAWGGAMLRQLREQLGSQAE